MKDSGIEWLGAIPEHWEVAQNRRFLKLLEQGSSPAIVNQIFDQEHRVLKLSAIKKGKYIQKQSKLIDPKHFVKNYQVEQGDILMTRGNTPDLVADVCFVDICEETHLMISDLIYRLKYADKEILPKFINYFFLTNFIRSQIKICARGSSESMVKVSRGHIKSWIVLKPSIEEQEKIINFLDQKSNEIKLMQNKIQFQIKKLTELKQILIAEAVTGKIKV